VTDDRALVITDAGPLIHLDELDCLDLLATFRRILVPEAVWREVECHRPQALLRADIKLERIGVDNPDPRVDTLARTFVLHTGEREALGLIEQFPDALFLTDDSAARLAAMALSVRVHGSIGMILRSLRLGQRSRKEVVQLLRDLPLRSTLFIKPSLLAEIISEIESPL